MGQLLVLLLLSGGSASATNFRIDLYYASDSCESNYVYQAHAVEVAEGSNYTEEACYAAGSSMTKSTTCAEDYVATVENLLGNATQYVLTSRFDDNNCSSLTYGYAVTVLDQCVENLYRGGYSISTLNEGGSASIQYFSEPACGFYPYATKSADTDEIDSHTCDSSNFSWYASSSSYSDASLASSSNEKDAPAFSPPQVGGSYHESSVFGRPVAIASYCFSFIIIVLVVVIVVLARRLREQKTQAPTDSQTGLWEDDTIVATRIPRNKITVKKLLCRGAFGEVYTGVFNKKPVAIKMLLRNTRTNIQHVNEFLTEAKLTAVMDHPNIVYFIGVAWESLSNLCIVLEFMDGGDLRTLLNTYESSNHPVGLDRQKVSIALHICHALTYLHSFPKPIIHRDLKSRNVLLDRNLTAKLTDFGISRERLDRTMTAGVGTSLWMAPEVMLGEKYDEKADMFSFGVLLSELDVHTLPYAREKQRSLQVEGRPMADATLFQRVANGTIRVDFSYMSPASVVELGRTCVAVDPTERPSAAETLYKLQVILAQELQW